MKGFLALDTLKSYIMKNKITQFAIAVIAFIAITFLMSYTHPATEIPKQYIVVEVTDQMQDGQMMQVAVNQKIAEGWQPQGGVSSSGNVLIQAMVK